MLKCISSCRYQGTFYCVSNRKPWRANRHHGNQLAQSYIKQCRGNFTLTCCQQWNFTSLNICAQCCIITSLIQQILFYILLSHWLCSWMIGHAKLALVITTKFKYTSKFTNLNAYKDSFVKMDTNTVKSRIYYENNFSTHQKLRNAESESRNGKIIDLKIIEIMINTIILYIHYIMNFFSL